MNRSMASLAAVLMIAATKLTQPTLAEERPQLLVMGEDANKGSLFRGSRVYEILLNSLASAMRKEGFKIYNEPIANLDDLKQERVRWTDVGNTPENYWSSKVEFSRILN